jgi:hypothetical protein
LGDLLARLEQTAEQRSGGAITLFKNMRVHAEGYRRVTVTKASSHRAHVDAGANQLRRREVPKVVEANFLVTKAVPDAREEPSHIVWPEGLAPILVRGEHESLRADGGLRLARPFLDLGTVTAQQRYPDGAERKNATPVRFSRLFSHATEVDDDRTSDVDDALGQVNIGPAESAEFAPAHPGERAEE